MDSFISFPYIWIGLYPFLNVWIGLYLFHTYGLVYIRSIPMDYFTSVQYVLIGLYPFHMYGLVYISSIPINWFISIPYVWIGLYPLHLLSLTPGAVDQSDPSPLWPIVSIQLYFLTLPSTLQGLHLVASYHHLCYPTSVSLAVRVVFFLLAGQALDLLPGCHLHPGYMSSPSEPVWADDIGDRWQPRCLHQLLIMSSPPFHGFVIPHRPPYSP